MKDMCETAKERYQKALTIFEASLRRGRPTKLSEVCRDNKVYYRGMLKWLYQTSRTIADIRKCGDAYNVFMKRTCAYFTDLVLALIQ